MSRGEPGAFAGAIFKRVGERTSSGRGPRKREDCEERQLSDRGESLPSQGYDDRNATLPNGRTNGSRPSLVQITQTRASGSFRGDTETAILWLGVMHAQSALPMSSNNDFVVLSKATVITISQVIAWRIFD